MTMTEKTRYKAPTFVSKVCVANTMYKKIKKTMSRNI